MAEKKENKKVTIHLFRDDSRYVNDLVVGVDGKLYKVKRGVDVEVPESVAMVIEQSLRRKGELDEMIYRKTKEAEKN